MEHHDQDNKLLSCYLVINNITLPADLSTEIQVTMVICLFLFVSIEIIVIRVKLV